MKKSIYTLLLLFVSLFSLQAATTYYVNPAHNNASDENAGTDPAMPWTTLNSEVWRNSDDCIINVAAGKYFFTSRISVGGNVQIVGSAKADVIFLGAEDEDFEEDYMGNVPYTPSGFFDINGGKTVSFSNITMKNMRLGSEENTEPLWGGMITSQTGTKLIVNNVDFIKAIMPIGGGAGIDCKGSLDLTNVRFQECSADRQGSTISLAGDSKAKLEGCQFINNTGLASGASTIQVYPNTTSAELIFNNCFFENNTYTGYGSAINVGNFTGGKLKFHITNSAFANNGGESAGCIFITTSDTPREIDLLVRNSTFLKNTLSVGVHGVIYQMNMSSTNTINGSISFINNTMYHNQRAEGGTGGTSGVYFQDMSVNFNYINNLSLCDNEDMVFFANPEASKNCVPVIKGNVFENVGGGSNTLTNLLNDLSTNKKVGQLFSEATDTEPEKPYIDGNDAVKLETTLTFPDNNNAPYLKIQEGSAAIDAGIIDGVLVPELDIRGQAIVNEKKDAGVFEYNSNAETLEKAENVETIRAYPNPFTNNITLNQEIAKAEIFNASGICVLSVYNVSSIDAANLGAGFYLLRTTTNEGVVSTLKIQK